MLKSFSTKFRKLKLKESSSTSQLGEASQPSSTTEESSETPPQPGGSTIPAVVSGRNDRYGLLRLDDAKPVADSREIMGVDIVAIHGLNGDAFSTWEHENGTLWLRDLLPSALPGSRIFTYGYPSKLFFSKSLASLRDYSQRLLSSLLDISIGNAQRPIIFVCHSLGGIVCKQALVLAHEEDHRYGKILAATSSVVFFGTPHRGTKGIADIANVIGNIVNTCLRVSQTAGIAGFNRTDLLNALASNSESLKDLAISFRNRLDGIKVVTFLETMPISPLSDLIVDRHSAIMDIHNEAIIPLYSNHVDMCRFEGKNSEYDAVSNALIRLAQESVRTAAKKRDSSDRSLNEAERSCMVLLNSADLAEYKTQLPRPVHGTCNWILNHPQYLSWARKEETSLLWVTGEPGCGKTMLSAYLTEHLKLGNPTASQCPVYYFFCDDKIAMQRDASAIIRSILYQMLLQHRRLIKHVKTRYESYGPSLATSFSTLWELFLKVAGDLRPGPLGVIVDALDECEERTRRIFLNAVMQLVHESQGLHHQQQNWIKFLITSRPSLGNYYNFNGFVKSRLPIEQHQNSVSEDVKLVIRSKVEEIAAKLGCPDETKEYLEQILFSKADHTFLWLDMVLQCLEDTLLASKKDIERIINTFPRDLETTYAKFWYRIPPESREYARKILRVLTGSCRHLTLTEVNIAFTIDENHETTEHLRNDYQPSIVRTLQGIAGSFVRIQSLTVSLIHQSAKEFLTDVALRSEDSIVRSCGISSADAALSLAWPCARYLLLQDFAADLFAAERTSCETNTSDSPVMATDTMGLDNILGLEEDRIFMDQSVLEEETCLALAEQYEFFDYSVTYWAEHFARCESIASEGLQEAVRQLTTRGSCVLKNWLKYFWIKKNMEYPYPDDFDSITVAAFFNFPILLRTSLESDRSYNQLRKDRALFWAARMGCADSVEVLLLHHGNPNRQTIDLHNPVTVGAEFGHLHVVETLLACPRTVLISKGKSGRSALSFAAGNGHLEIVKLLMSHKDCRAEEEDANRWTPLFWAVGGDHIAVIEHLLNHQSVDINRVDRNGRSVVSWAAGSGLLRASRILFKHPKADINLKDSTGRSPLSWAAGNGHTQVVTALMRDRRVDKSSKDLHQRNAISWACQGGHTDTLRTLLKYGCGGEDDPDISGWTPLAWALFHKSTSTVEALISGSRMRIDSQDARGRTALMWAASYGYLEVVQLLLSRGANPQAEDNKGRTAIEYARMYDYVEIIEELEGRLLSDDRVARE